MLVKIGKYPSRLTCNIHSNYMNKKYGYVDWPTKYTRFERVLERVEDRVQDLYNIFNRLWVDRRQQKVSVRLDRWDTWSMDATLGYIILPMLKQLKETKQGSPFVYDEDVPHLPKYYSSSNGRMQYDLFDSEEQDGLLWKQHEVRWDWVMDEMIFAFESLVGENKDWEDKYHTGVTDIVSVPVDVLGNEVDEEDAKFFRWDKGPNDTSEFDKEGHRAEAERIQNGFRLFGRYFQNLWS